MSKKAKLATVQRFPEASVDRWRKYLRDLSVRELFEPIVLPRNATSQLKAVKEVYMKVLTCM